ADIAADAASRGIARHVLAGPAGTINDVHFSPDGELVAASSQDGLLSLWDVKRGRARGQLAGLAPDGRFAFAPDGAWIAAPGPEGALFLWSPLSHEVHRLTGHSDRVLALEFSRAGGTLVSGGLDGSLRVWDVR